MADEPSNRWKKRQPCLAAKSAGQWGNIITAQLGACVVTGAVISRWVAEGRLHRLDRGGYAVGHRNPAPEARWSAALLAYDGSVLTRHTALANHGLGKPPQVVTVAVPKQARKQRGVEPHSSMPFERDEVVIRRGLRTTSIERTLLDLAAIGEPVARLVAEAVAKRLISMSRSARSRWTGSGPRRNWSWRSTRSRPTAPRTYSRPTFAVPSRIADKPSSRWKVRQLRRQLAADLRQ
jgi:hypothetical protein